MSQQVATDARVPMTAVHFLELDMDAKDCNIRDSIVVSICACHAEDPGSIPGRGVLDSRGLVPIRFLHVLFPVSLSVSARMFWHSCVLCIPMWKFFDARMMGVSVFSCSPPLYFP